MKVCPSTIKRRMTPSAVAQTMFFPVLDPRPVGAGQSGNHRLGAALKRGTWLWLRRPARSLIQFAECAGRRREQSDHVRIAVKDRGRPARPIDPLEALASEPAHALAHLWLLRPGHIVADIHVAGRQELRLLLGSGTRPGQEDSQKRHRTEPAQTHHQRSFRLYDPAQAFMTPPQGRSAAITGRAAIRFKSLIKPPPHRQSAPCPRANSE